MKIERINKGSWGKVRAFFDLITSEGFTIKGFKIIEGINGLFVSMPSQKGSDGEYYDSIYASKELRDELNKLALDAYGSQYDQTLSQTSGPQTESQEAEESKLNSSSENDQSAEEKAQAFSDDDIPF
tara:strand:+ start:1517 stop:1897 length:381 start_codon:yes stop_codon:yes gene_type:complete